MLKIFISHSSKDIVFVEKIVELLKVALLLPAKEIRCTSLPGHALSGGADIRDQLRKEVDEADVFICIISKESLKSLYTVFELGARWGTKKNLIPILSYDVDYSILRPPLSLINAIQCDTRSKLHQLLELDFGHFVIFRFNQIRNLLIILILLVLHK